MESEDVSEKREWAGSAARWGGIWSKRTMARPTLKRFAWLWGALIGAVLFPLLMMACYYVSAHTVPSPSGGTPHPISFSTLWTGLLVLTKRHGGWCGALGCCGAMLWIGNCSLKWRLLSIGVGMGTMSYLLWDISKQWPAFTLGALDWERWSRCVYTLTRAPLLLAAILLVFLALLLRSSPPAATKS